MVEPQAADDDPTGLDNGESDHLDDEDRDDIDFYHHSGETDEDDREQPYPEWTERPPLTEAS